MRSLLIQFKAHNTQVWLKFLTIVKKHIF